MTRRPRIVIAVLAMCALLIPSGATAQTPVVTPGASPVSGDDGWRITDVQEIEVDGEPLVLSPDGRWLAGIGPEGGSICIWDVASLTPACADEGLVIAPFPLTPPLVWAPDSSAVAFVDGAAQLGGPTDVMLFDVESNSLTNLTNAPDGDGECPVHIGAAWTAESERVLFTAICTGGPSGIMWVDVDSGESGQVPLDGWDMDFLIGWPVFTTPDDTIVFRVDRADDAEEIEGVWRVSIDGADLTQLVVADGLAPRQFPVPLGVTADGDYVSVASAEAIRRNDIVNAFYLVDARSGDVSHLEINGNQHVLGPPVFAPDGDVALVAGGDDPAALVHVLDLQTGRASPVPGIEAGTSWFMTPPSWAGNDTVFIPGDGGGVLVTIEWVL